MSDTKAVLRKLLQDCLGEDNAITQSKLSKATGVNKSTLRSELRRLREERQIPIANQRDGYYIIADKEELSDFIGHINQEIESKRNTIEHTLEAFENFDRDSIDIPEESDQEPVEQTYPCAKCGADVPTSKVKYPSNGEFDGQPLCSKHYGELVMQGET